MYQAIVFLPLLGSLIAGLFGRVIGARPAELITTTLLFVSAAGKHITGQYMAVDGGVSIVIGG